MEIYEVNQFIIHRIVQIVLECGKDEVTLTARIEELLHIDSWIRNNTTYKERKPECTQSTATG